MSKVILQGYIEVLENELEIIMSELETHKSLTRNEEGCLTFEVNQSSKEPTRFDV